MPAIFRAQFRAQSAVWLGLLAAPVVPALLPAPVQAQQTSRVLLTGTVRDAAGRPLEQVAVGVEGMPGGTSTDDRGRFALNVVRPLGSKPPVLVIRRLGHRTERIPLDLSSQRELVLTMQEDSRALGNVTVRGRTEAADTREQVSILQLEPRTAKEIPSPFGDFSAVLKTLPGVASTNELTSTYSVRGGNYEENLVYVNGFEVYRPFLVTAAVQEGLSFVNPDLVSRIEFSTGGWQPKYGDKLSSVLDIQYTQPDRFEGSATASLVGGTVHAGAASANKRLSYLAGVRYKNATYVFNSLQQQQGGYNPTFYDGQSLITLNLGPKDNLERTGLSLFNTFAHNDFRFNPESGQSSFSTGTNQLSRLYIGYAGRERMQYDMYQGGLRLHHDAGRNLRLELLGGLLYSREFEYRDVEAAYSIAEINRDQNSPDYGGDLNRRGLGSRFQHSRNNLLARIASLETRGTWTPGERNTVRWGLKVGQEQIEDELNEYSFVDSVDYVPEFRRTRLRSSLNLESTRTQGYLQHTIRFDSLRTLTYGARASYWTVNRQATVSPRVQYSFTSARNPRLAWKAAVGLYHQPPFYRELRYQTGAPQSQEGVLNLDLRAQRSLHFIVGNELRFTQWGRPFRFTGEAYYKYLTDVVPYDIDNVRLRYQAQNKARAYAAGLDARVSGEFIPGTESWFSLGVLTTRENLAADSINTFDANGGITGRVPKGYIRRPSDQRLNLGVFLQDNLPGNPSVKGYVNLVFGTGLPFSPPDAPDLRGTSKLTRSYKRADLGFTKVLSLRSGVEQQQGRAVQLRSLWMSLEVLNVLGADNLAGYNYIQDLNGVTYSVPNFLSRRLVNLRVIARF
ncbi:TonB-dependent receptor plug domain-containing protein [Hymenobacter endophyticus]|uniref:TonB-dependent receptor plug domain-containing protein n=1 Tax=Hymenobacter endophyticus TaxID=3076335 RepID=A0ABU3TFF9_9BACT|nr:TonB-dependent receptor plug domain-containing protein [Hymenobacter endophyticus]MDU0370111.1 TonB-dependent receptor plug domain-containing protein [Hymenobacter endophyticus]